ncbi:hypothetical protein [Georgenia sp. MJ170]|uniref:hypothetical protein n=1 Tax=Georgenia sunbinii TaxID=3117728 RepID=UPI002F266E0F
MATFLLGIGIGVVSSSTDPTSTPEYTTLATERDDLAAQVKSVEVRAAEAEDQIGAAEQRADDAESASEDRAGELDERSAALDERETELAGLEGEVAEREAAVGTAEDRVAETQINNGMWTVGVDVEPGTYRVVEALTDRCYWAILRTGSNGGDIIENALPSGGFPTVTLSDGQDFENSCGVWNQQ